MVGSKEAGFIKLFVVKFINEKSLIGIMVDVVNATVGFFEPVRSIIGAVSYVIGGIFGVYLILLVVRWWQNRIMIRLLKDIKYDLDQQNKKLKLSHSKELFESKVYKKFSGVFEKEK